MELRLVYLPVPICTNIFLKKTSHRLRCFTKGNLDKQTGQQWSNSGKYRCPVDACILVTKWCKTVQELQYTYYSISLSFLKFGYKLRVRSEKNACGKFGARAGPEGPCSAGKLGKIL